MRRPIKWFTLDCEQIINTERYKDGLASFFYRLRYNQETNKVLHFVEIECDQMKDTEQYKDGLASFFTGWGTIRRPIKCFRPNAKSRVLARSISDDGQTPTVKKKSFWFQRKNWERRQTGLHNLWLVIFSKALSSEPVCCVFHDRKCRISRFLEQNHCF